MMDVTCPYCGVGQSVVFYGPGYYSKEQCTECFEKYWLRHSKLDPVAYKFDCVEIRSMLVQHLRHKVTTGYLKISNESDLQDQLYRVFQNESWAEFKREIKLSDQDRIDFLDEESGIGIEVKVRGNANEILKQLERYAQSDKVKVLILATATFMGLPENINGKPIYMFHLTRGML